MDIYTRYTPDDMDWNILRELAQNARLPFAELGRRVGLSAPSVAERVQKMKDAGIIERYSVFLNPTKLGLPVTAFIRISLNKIKASTIIEKAKKISEIVECHRATGNDCIILKVRVESIEKLEVLTDKFTGLGQLTTSVVLSTAFEKNGMGHPMVEIED